MYCSSKLSPVERERLRERDREARVKLTYDAEQRVPQDTFNPSPLFGAIVRLNPKSNDRERQQIERKLGIYDEVKHLLDQDSAANLYGIDGQPPPSPAPAALGSSSLSSLGGNSSSSNVHEFKKPNACSQPQQNRSSHHHHHHHTQRGGFVKPADGKPPYGGRGSYPGHPIKPNSSSSNDFRSGSMAPVKGPPAANANTTGGGGANNTSSNGSVSNVSNPSHHSVSSSSSGRSSGSHEFSSKIHQSSRTLPKLHPELNFSNLSNSGSAPSQANVENILDEMTSAVRTPLTAIAATPRKETESKFIFNPALGKMESLSPIKSPVVDKNKRDDLLKSILAPVTRVPTSVFKPGDLGNPITPFSSSSSSNSPSATSNNNHNISNSTNSNLNNNANNGGNVTSKSKLSNSSSASTNSSATANASNANSSSKTIVSANLPYVKSLSLSEDSEDEEDEDDDNNNEDSEEENSSKSASSSSVPPPPKPEPNSGSPPTKLESNANTSSTDKLEMSVEDERASSSSDDSDSDSCSDSEDSSSDSPSPPSLPLPELPDQVDSKRWNLNNFLPASVRGNTTPAPLTPQVCESGEKLKTDDSDSSAEQQQRPRKTRTSSSSSSESDDESNVKSRAKSSRKTASAHSDGNLSDDNGGNRRTRAYCSSSSSQSSDDESERIAAKKKSGANVTTAGANTAANANSSGTATGMSSSAAAATTSNVTVVGVVRPHQRKPPSPQVYGRGRLSPPPQSAGDERFGGYVPQRASAMQMTPATSESQLPGHGSSDGSVLGRGRLSDAFGSRGNATAEVQAGGKTNAMKPTVAAVKSGKGRRPKSDPVAPPKKRPGRKRTKMTEISDSEDEERKVKVSGKKRPGRPPLKRTNDRDDVDWKARPGSRKVLVDKFPSSSVWGELKSQSRRRTTSFASIVDSDSDEPSTAAAAAPLKPTARVQPAIKKKEGGRTSRESSCESSRGAGDYALMSSVGAKNGANNVTKAEDSPPKLDVEGGQDKKKNVTLQKLFSRTQKGGGKGKDVKAKMAGGVIIESESERKQLLHRSSSGSSPAAALHHIDHHRMADIPTTSPLRAGQPTGSVSRYATAASRRQGRVSEIDSSLLPSTSSSSPSSSSLPVDPLPKLTYNEHGKPSLLCKIDLSKIPYILAKKPSEEMRIRSDLSNTRQQPTVTAAAVAAATTSASSAAATAATSMDVQQTPPSLDMVGVNLIEPMSPDDVDDTQSLGGCRSKKHSATKTKTAKCKRRAQDETSPPSQMFKSAAPTPSVDPETDSSDSEPRGKKCKQRMSVRPTDSVHNLMSSCYPMPAHNVSVPPSSLCVDRGSDDESWRSDVSSCLSCSSSPMTVRNDTYCSHGKRSSKHHHSMRPMLHRRNDITQRHPSLNDTAPSLMHVPAAGYGGPIAEAALNPYQMNIAGLVRPTVPTHHGIYYSYLEHKASEEISSESDNLSPDVYLSEAKRLKYAADRECDRVAQGMKYLEAILSFVLTGVVLERRNQMDTAFSMYTETLKLIVYISNKFRQICTSAAQPNTPNKIAILSLRCESILNLKLYTMREFEVRDVHNAVTEYFSKPVPMDACLVPNQGIPSPHSPTPSPASSVGSNSSGYSSGDRRTSGVAQCIAVPVTLHQALQKQHNLYSNLIASFNYWEEADGLIFSGGNKDFFIELDRFCGPLTLHSSLKDLVHYVRVGIQRLKAIISHQQRV